MSRQQVRLCHNHNLRAERNEGMLVARMQTKRTYLGKVALRLHASKTIRHSAQREDLR